MQKTSAITEAVAKWSGKQEFTPDTPLKELFPGHLPIVMIAQDFGKNVPGSTLGELYESSTFSDFEKFLNGN